MNPSELGLSQMVGPRFGAVRLVSPLGKFSGFENVHFLVGQSGLSQSRLGFGFSVNQNRAATAAAGEALEREGARQTPYLSELVNGTYVEIKSRFPVLPLEAMTLFSNEQVHTPGFPFKNIEEDDRIDWLRGKCFTATQTTEIYYPFPRLTLGHKSKPFDRGTSSGFALQSNFKAAFHRALCEILERDAFLTAWWLKRPPPVYSCEDLENAGFSFAELHWLKGRVFILDLTDEWDVPTFAALLFGRNSRGEPALAVGGAASDTAHDALERAILESLVTLVFFMQKKLKNKPTPLPPFDESIQTFSDNFYLYASDFAAQARFLIDGPRPGYKKLKSRLESPPVESLTDRVFRRGARILSFDMTPFDLHLAGLSLARVVVPEAIPLNGAHAARPWGCPKLRSFPAAALNPLPHPFP